MKSIRVLAEQYYNLMIAWLNMSTYEKVKKTRKEIKYVITCIPKQQLSTRVYSNPSSSLQTSGKQADWILTSFTPFLVSIKLTRTSDKMKRNATTVIEWEWKPDRVWKRHFLNSTVTLRSGRKERYKSCKKAGEILQSWTYPNPLLCPRTHLSLSTAFHLNVK